MSSASTGAYIAKIALLKLALAMAVLALAHAAPAMAQPSVADFYRGKSIDLVIGYSTGGGYDAYARLVGRFIGAHIPGNPNIIPKQMVGGGTRIAAGWVYNVGPKDGTVLATADQSTPVQQAIGDPTIHFDAAKFNWIGNPTADNNTATSWHMSGVRTIEDARRIPIAFAGAGINISSQLAQALNTVAGTKFKIVLGYPGSNEMSLALERGEAGAMTNTWASWKANTPDWIRDKKIHVLVQMGLTKMAELPDAPLLIDLAANELDRKALYLLSAAATLGRPLFTSPAVPPERVKALRDAFEATMKDPAFLDAAARAGLDINPVSGEMLQKVVVEAVASPKAVADRLAEIIALPDQEKR